MDFGITAVGAYVPRLRLSRAAIAAAHRWMVPSPGAGAKGERAFCSWDEDAITMAVEAARDAVAPEARGAIRALTLASTTLPYADMSNAAVAAAALDLAAATRTGEATGSQRAATSALTQAIEAKAAGTLIVAAERPMAKPASAQEMQVGAGAAALLLGTGELIAKVLGTASVHAAFADHVRAAGATSDYGWEERWIRDEGLARIVPQAIAAALADAGVAARDLAHFVMPTAIRGAAASVAKAAGFRGEVADDLSADCGLAGAAHAFLMLAKALETAEAGAKILLVGFGQGADAIVLEATGRRPAGRGVSGALADRVPTGDYLRMLSFYGRIDLEWGMRAEAPDKAALTNAWREAEQLSAFKAGRCPDCGQVQFPQLAFCVTPGCGAPAERFAQAPLADQPAKVLTFTADWLSHHPAPPLVVGFVQFANGARLLMETVDADPAAIDVGQPLRMVFRLKKADARSGYRRYFWKATPATV